MTFSRFLLVAFVCSMICGHPALSEEAIVDVLVRGPQAYFDLHASQLPDFHRQHPRLRVNLIHQKSGAYWDKMTVMYASGVLPDVVWVAPAQGFDLFAASGMFQDLEPIARADGYSLGQFYPFLIAEACRVNGRLYMLPQVYHPGTAGLFYNTGMFDGAGLPSPDSAWTYDDMADAARRLTIDEDGAGMARRFGAGPILSRPGAYLGVLKSYGGGILADDRRASLLGHPGTIAGFEFMRRMSWDTHSAPRLHETALNDESLFFAERAAMFISGYWTKLNLAAAGKDLAWSVAPSPVGPAGRYSGQGNTEGWAMSRQGRNQQAAWLVMKWLVSDEVQRRLVAAGSNTVSRHSVNTRAEFMRDLVHQVFVQALAEDAFEFSPVPHNYRYADMMNIVNTNVRDPIWAGELSVIHAIDQAKTLLEALLAEEPRTL